MVGTNRFVFKVTGRTPPDLYQFKAVSGGLVDPFGQPLDGNGNGVGGDDFVRTFTIVKPGTGPEMGGDGRVALLTAVGALEREVLKPALQSGQMVELLDTDQTGPVLQTAEVDQAFVPALTETPANISTASEVGSAGQEWADPLPLDSLSLEIALQVTPRL